MAAVFSLTRFFRAGVSPLALLAAGLALTGGVTPAQADADAPTGLEEVVVVGEKKETNLQKAPESITAVSGNTLEQAGAVTPLDLNGLVPGLVITTSEGYDRSVSIRGVGFNTPQVDSAQPSVSYHADGIYIANPVALNSGFLDADHVEVLRGPQGTVFGQNSVGGTLNVISKQPTFDAVTGFADVSYGSYDLVHSTAAINLPITSDFAIRTAVDQVFQHGYVHATQVPGSDGRYDLSDQNNYHGRMLALWKPTDDLTVELRGEYAEAHQHESEGKNILDPDTNPYQESSDWPGKFTYDQKLVAATITYQMPWASVKSLTSWQAVNQGISVNEDGLDLALMSPLHDVQWFTHNSQTVTQEIDLSSLPGTRLDWVVGGFYLHNRYKVAYDQYDAAEGNDFTPNLLNSYPNPSAQAIAEVFSGEFTFPNTGLEERRSYSGYGQATYHITDALRVTGGARYSLDHNSTYFSEYFNLDGPPIFVQKAAEKITYRAAVDYDLTETNLLYASYSTGFKPGGGNLSENPITVPYQYRPETVTAYEVGSKNTFLDKKLTFNLSGFYYKDRNEQYQADDESPYQGGVDNIPDVDIYGIEAELSALLPYHLRLDSNLTAERGHIPVHFYALDNVAGNNANNAFIAQYGINAFNGCLFLPASVFLASCPQLAAARLGAYHDVYGNAPPNMPEFAGSMSLSHTLDLADGSALLSRVSVQYRDDYADTIFGKSSIYTAPGYTLVNLYFDYIFPNDKWDAALYVNNVGNIAAVLSRFTNQYGGETTQQYAPPREFIARVGYRF